MLRCCVLLALLAGSACCTGGDSTSTPSADDEAEYLKANQAILEALPTYASATVKSRSDSPYYLTEQGPVSGYTTNVVYRVPTNITDDAVIAFYIQQLGDDWQHCSEQIPVRAIVPAGATPPTPLGFVKNVSFFRVGAEVSVNLDGLGPVTRPNTYEIAVDHEAAHNPCTGEDLK